MIFGILTLITALCISAVAIYYSVAGLVAIFAAAALPIMIMGGTLEIAKLVTAVWLHKYWSRATWWLKTYLSVSVVVLMFITSMGIFGFLSKAHIEQTSASEESVARVESITSEIARQNAIVTRANTRIAQLENSETGADATIQAQIDKEQTRIDLAFERIKPAIEQQNKIITDTRTDDATRTKPYEDQLASITAEVLRLESSAREYEDKIAGLDVDSSGVEPLLAQIAQLEEEIIRVTNQLNSKEQQQIRAGQAIIGVTSDGLFGGNTRTALATWVSGQRDRITQIQGEVAQVRKDATTTVDAERIRLADVVKDIRTVQIPALKERELTMLAKIDEVRQTESPVIQTARDEIQRLRASAESQVAQSQTLIERLRSQLGDVDNAQELEADIDEQQNRIRAANTEIDTLTEEKIALEAEYRKLEAEVGPIKYIAEFVYGEQADSNMLEEAVRWVIIIIIFVFDPLAVLLLIAAQYTFEFRRKELEDDAGERLRLERAEYERARAQAIVDNPVFNIDTPAPPAEEKEEVNDVIDRLDVEQSDRAEEGNTETGDNTNGDGDNTNGDSSRGDRESVEKTDGEYDVGANDIGRDDSDRVDGDTSRTRQQNLDIPDTKNRMFYPEELEPKKKVNLELPEESNPNSRYYADREQDDAWVTDRAIWEANNPGQDRAAWRHAFETGEINSLPWEQPTELDNYNVQEGYQQNAEQSDNTLFNKLSNK
jgi:hypothetical protein